MADFGETAKPRVEKITHPPPLKEKPFSFAANLSGRRVDFLSSKGLSWGIELTIPVDNPLVRSGLTRGTGMELPERINKIRFLDLAPQESLPGRLRNIRSNRPFYAPTPLQVLARKTVSSPTVERLSGIFVAPRPADSLRIGMLRHLFYDIFGSNRDRIEKFNLLLEESRGREIVIVCGHGAYSEISEQYDDELRDAAGNPIQRAGNRVSIKKVLERYDEPENFAAILIHSCYIGSKKIVAKRVPVVRAIGIVGGVRSMLSLNPTEVATPRKKLTLKDKEERL